MALKAKSGAISPHQTLRSTVKQRNMSRVQMSWQSRQIDCKTVILRSDVNPPCILVFYRMIPAMMAVFHFEGFSTAGQRHDLVPKTDAKSGDAAIHRSAGSFDRVITGLWVARAIG